ncbi:MAG: IS110 family transposase [Alphaproteobacteria bacterium]|nr:IS110 family transposase [Alphaproteobacteria bacterium]
MSHTGRGSCSRRSCNSPARSVAATRTSRSWSRSSRRTHERARQDHVLLTIPGVGELTLAVLLAEAGDPHRFATVDKFIGYCGLYPGSKRSGDGGYSTRMVRKGNRMLRLQILLASTTARQFNAPVRAFYRRKVEQGQVEQDSRWRGRAEVRSADLRRLALREALRARV